MAGLLRYGTPEFKMAKAQAGTGRDGAQLEAGGTEFRARRRVGVASPSRGP